jgi:hypothetical protein
MMFFFLDFMLTERKNKIKVFKQIKRPTSKKKIKKLFYRLLWMSLYNNLQKIKAEIKV